MQTADRIFGSSPRIHLANISLMVLVYYVRTHYMWASLGLWEGAHLTAAAVCLGLWALIASWSLVSLGRKIGLTVLTRGPYKYVQHPLYAAEIFFGWLIVFFLLDTWLAFVGMIIVFALAPYLVIYEEDLMQRQFGDSWKTYHTSTPRFFPKLFGGDSTQQ